eukprot:scaffold44671_cov183-Amphora_coffeaeformis.AAC.3
MSTTDQRSASIPTQTESTLSSSWDSVAVQYETCVEPFTALFLEELLSHVDTLPRPCHLLDVGCGTGAVSLLAREKGFDVTATDFSVDMIERLRQRWKEQTQKNCCPDQAEQASLVEAVAANGQDLPKHWTNRFHLAIGAFSVIFFSNVPKGLTEIYRCLLPNKQGRVALSAWGDASETPAFQVFPDAFRAVAPELMTGAEIRRITGSPAALKKLLEDAGFVDIYIEGPVWRTLRVASAEVYFDRFACGSPNTRTKIEKLAQLPSSSNDCAVDRVAALKKKVMELAEARGGGYEDKSIQLPAAAYFAYGTKP